MKAEDTIHFRQFTNTDFKNEYSLEECQDTMKNAYITIGEYLMDHAEELSKAHTEADSSTELIIKIPCDGIVEISQKIDRYVINNSYPKVREDYKIGE